MHETPIRSPIKFKISAQLYGGATSTPTMAPIQQIVRPASDSARVLESLLRDTFSLPLFQMGRRDSEVALLCLERLRSSEHQVASEKARGYPDVAPDRMGRPLS